MIRPGPTMATPPPKAQKLNPALEAAIRKMLATSQQSKGPVRKEASNKTAKSTK
jgi:hypothetical protein